MERDKKDESSIITCLLVWTPYYSFLNTSFTSCAQDTCGERGGEGGGGARSFNYVIAVHVSYFLVKRDLLNVDNQFIWVTF